MKYINIFIKIHKYVDFFVWQTYFYIYCYLLNQIDLVEKFINIIQLPQKNK